MIMEKKETQLDEILSYEQPTRYIVSSSNYTKDKSDTPVLTAGKTFILGYTKEKQGIFQNKLPVIIFDDFTTAIKLVDFPFKVKSSAMKILSVDTSKADVRYIYYAMQNIHFSVRKHKRHWISEYSKIKIMLPPLAEQKRIADMLSKVFIDIENSIQKTRQNSKLSSKTTYSELLSTFNDDTLKTYLLEDVCDTTSGGTPSRSIKSYYDGDISWLKSGELNDNRSISSSEEHISEDAIKKSNAKVFPSGTVLLAMYGATVGKLGILSANASTNQAVCAITPHKNILNEYMFWYLYFYRDELVKKAFGGAQPNISQTLIRKLPVKIPLKDNQPDLAKQKEIVAKVNTIQEKQEKLMDLFSRQEKLFASLRSSVLNQSFQMQT